MPPFGSQSVISELMWISSVTLSLMVSRQTDWFLWFQSIHIVLSPSSLTRSHSRTRSTRLLRWICKSSQEELFVLSHQRCGALRIIFPLLTWDSKSSRMLLALTVCFGDSLEYEID